MAWENLTDAEKGYIAGFLDGEGCITFCANGTQTRAIYPKINFYNTHKGVIDWISKSLNGKTLRRSTDIRRDKLHTKDTYAITIGKISDVFLLIKQVYPYLKVKKIQAELLINYCEWYFNRENWKYSEEEIKILNKYKIKMSKLNKGGEED